MRLLSKHFYSPYFIFLKMDAKMSDTEIMELLALEGYDWKVSSLEKRKEDMDKRYILFAREGEWVYIIDDIVGSLWGNQTQDQLIRKLGEQLDLFTCYFSDADPGFNFLFYKDGKRRREYVRGYAAAGLIIDRPKNVGAPLPGEEKAFTYKDDMDKVSVLLDSLGIKTELDEAKFSCYERREEEHEKFIFNEDEY